jgi:cell division septum initiation protein DivIVA
MMSNEQLLQQKIDHIVDDIDTLKEDVKDLNRRVNGHDTSIAKIELIVEGMKTDWAIIRSDIKRMMDAQIQAQNQNPTPEQNNTKTFVMALKEIAIELVKTIGLIVGAFLAAKAFFH